jgi:hypothetical protein
MPDAHESLAQQAGCRRRGGVLLLSTLGSAAIGSMVGLLHWVLLPIPPFFSDYFPDALQLALRLGTCIAAMLMAGVVLFRLTDWGLRNAHCTGLPLAVALGLGISALAATSVWHTYSWLAVAAWSQDSQAVRPGSAVAPAFEPLLDMTTFVFAILMRDVRESPRYLAAYAYVAGTYAYLTAMVFYSVVRATRRHGHAPVGCGPPAGLGAQPR